FFLPLYSPQMNRIEDEWLHLKRDELAGRVFEDEYELAITIMDGINHRAKQGRYQVERFTFN
ncbi:MAG: IS630 family transposase, partial [Cyanobacteriota bacterium]